MQVDSLFDSYDADGSGSLDVEELKPSLKRLVDAAGSAATELRMLRDSVCLLCKHTPCISRPVSLTSKTCKSAKH